MKKKYGEEKIHIFRRSWKIAPPPLNRKNPYHPLNIEIYKNIPLDKIPDTESLQNTYDRVIPFYKNNIENLIFENKNIIIVAHGNSIRSLCKYLFNLSDTKITELEIPTGNPLLINFKEKLKINSLYAFISKILGIQKIVYKIKMVSGFVKKSPGTVQNL